jgi:RHS repeat-associated protein
VRACDESACGGYSATGNAHILLRPGNPTNVSVRPTDIIQRQTVTISWNPASGRVTKYQLEQCPQGGTCGGLLYEGLSRTRSFPGPVTSDPVEFFTYRVRACNETVCGYWIHSNQLTVRFSSGHGGGGCQDHCPVPKTATPPTDSDDTGDSGSGLSASLAAPILPPSPSGRGTEGEGIRSQAQALATLRQHVLTHPTESILPAAWQPSGTSSAGGVHLTPAVWYPAKGAPFTGYAARPQAPSRPQQGFRYLPVGFQPYSATGTYRFSVRYIYDPSGALAEVVDANDPSQVYWQANAMDAMGHVIGETLGNGVLTVRLYNPATGFVEGISSGVGDDSGVQMLTYAWDGIGNLTERDDANQGLTEKFNYDSLNRLTGSTLTANGTTTANLSVAYDAIGNIKSKSGVGTYTYSSSHPHAVASISGAVTTSFSYDRDGNLLSGHGKSYGYTAFNKPWHILSGGADTQFWYAPDRSRYQQVTVEDGATTITLYIGGVFEAITHDDGSITYRNEIEANGRTIAIASHGSGGSAASIRYLHYDHLGSVDAVTNGRGGVIQRMSFDAFGQRRETDWGGTLSDDSGLKDYTDRGFTDQEQLDATGLIHMNGRVYDPVIGRFTSADPIVQAPFASQSLNRYSYVWNNPLSLTDPSGFCTGTHLCNSAGPVAAGNVSISYGPGHGLSNNHPNQHSSTLTPAGGGPAGSGSNSHPSSGGQDSGGGSSGADGGINLGTIITTGSKIYIPAISFPELTFGGQSRRNRSDCGQNGNAPCRLPKLTVMANQSILGLITAGAADTVWPGVETGAEAAGSTLLGAVASGIMLMALPTELGNGELTSEQLRKGATPRILYHYTRLPQLIGPLDVGSYLTVDGNLSSEQAIRQLALKDSVDTQLYRYTFEVYPGEYRPADNSISGTRLVRPANGQLGLGVEYQSTVPLVPIGPAIPAH